MPDPGAALVRLEVGAVATGGSCVARHQGRVVFVRHALPGEVVLARLLDDGADRRFWRAEAVEVLTASADRVPVRCPAAGPGGCGGCDWQHASPAAQREGKAAVVREQLWRLAGIERPDLVVEPLDGAPDGLGWRRRVRFAVGPDGRAGLRAHRSRRVVPIESCPIAHPDVASVDVPGRRWPGAGAIEVVTGDDGDPLVIVEPPDGGAGPRGTADLPPLPVPVSLARQGEDGVHRLRGRTWVEHRVAVTTADGAVTPRRFRVTGGGFWQVHPAAAQTLLDAVLAATAPRAGERVVDLYSGAGLFTAAAALAVGERGAVLGLESDPRACADARRNLYDLAQVRLEQGRVERRLSGLIAQEPWSNSAEVVVLDPPRAGAGRAVMESIVGLRPRVVAYVACDPASLARDLATATGLGYRLTALRAFDLFPMTHHVESLATLEPTP
jgi:tRNA/tmRNA/rRNA uracil-C5-methylase (TrmA/RlmC/RlmD family)